MYTLAPRSRFTELHTPEEGAGDAAMWGGMRILNMTARYFLLTGFVYSAIEDGTASIHQSECRQSFSGLLFGN